MRRAGPGGRAAAAAAAAPGSATAVAAAGLLLLAALAAPMPAAAQGPPALACAPGKCKPQKPTGATSPKPGKKTWMTKQNKKKNAFGLSKAVKYWADSYLAWHAEHDQWICHCTTACDHGVCDVLVDTQSSAGVQPTGQICADIETAYGPAPPGAPTILFNTINCGNPPFTKHIVDDHGVPDEVWCPGRVDEPHTCGQIGLGWDLSFYAGWKGKPWGPSYAPAAIGDTPEVLWRPRWYMLGLLLSTKTAGRKSLGCYPAAAAADFVAATTVEDEEDGSLPWLAGAEDGMTLDRCKHYCIATSVEDKARPAYKFFALQSGGACSCSASRPGPAPAGAAGACDVPCAGDAGQTCGGGGHVSVYRITGLPKRWLKKAKKKKAPEVGPSSRALLQASGPRPRPESELAILYKYTLGAKGGWNDFDPTPGGCDNPKGNSCGPWRLEPIPWSAGKQKYAMRRAKKQKMVKKWKLANDGSWYGSKVRSAMGITKIPGRGRPEMAWYRDSYAVYHPELGRHVCHCMVSGKPACTFLDPETGTYVRDAATWAGFGGDGSGAYGCIIPGDYNGSHQAEVDTPVGVKPLAEVCQDIEATFGPGPVANRIFFNTIQCGHGGVLHRHGHGDEDLSVFDQAYFEDGIEVEAVCPGVIGRYTKKGKWKNVYNMCGLVGPAFELETVYANGNDPDGVSPAIGVAGVGDGTTGSTFVKPEDWPPL